MKELDTFENPTAVRHTTTKLWKSNDLHKFSKITVYFGELKVYFRGKKGLL